MGELVRHVDTDVSPARLWATATDWAGQGEWIPLTRAWLVGDGETRLGSRVEAWTGIGRVGFLDVMIIDEWEPPRVLALRHVGKVVRGAAGFMIEPVGARGSRITWWERIDLPLGRVGALAWPLVGRVAGWQLQRSLRALAAVASAGADRTDR